MHTIFATEQFHSDLDALDKAFREHVHQDDPTQMNGVSENGTTIIFDGLLLSQVCRIPAIGESRTTHKRAVFPLAQH